MAEGSTEFALCTYQDGRAFSVEEIVPGEQIHGQNRPKRFLFFSASKPRVTKLKDQIYQSSCALLWRQHQDICKTTKNSHFSIEEIKCLS